MTNGGRLAPVGSPMVAGGRGRLSWLSYVSARARILGLLPLAALGVHDLRFQLAFGHEAHHELGVEGHAYLNGLFPLCVLLAALVAGELIVRVCRARPGDGVASPPYRFVTVAATITAALIAIYTGQELLEGILSAGHPAGVEGIFGDGGWLAIPLAGLMGAAIALFAQGAARAIARVARARFVGGARRAVARVSIGPAEALLPRLSPLAGAAPGRAPPGAAPVS
ncbi:MAG TPA: hypothetical protein VH391_09850 [Solirubrobacterales bacterium]